MEKYDFFLFAIAISITCSFLSVLVEKFMIHVGLIRGNTLWLAINVFFFALLNQLANFNQSKIMFALLLILGGPIGTNRYDLGNTIRKGKWWWKANEE